MYRNSLLALLATSAAWHGAMASEQSPYVGEEQRAIKSLSTQEIRSLRNGEGMGFAKLAELNHFPGPKHVLEVSGELGLSQPQLAATRSIFEEMRLDSIALGEQLIELERQLDQAFSSASVTAASLERALLEIGRIRARIRYVHLESHLRQRQLLTAEQIAKYDAVRGYQGTEREHREHSNSHK